MGSAYWPVKRNQFDATAASFTNILLVHPAARPWCIRLHHRITDFKMRDRAQQNQSTPTTSPAAFAY